MNSSRVQLIFSLIGYAFLGYLFVLLPGAYYEPTRAFHLPGFLWFIHLIILYIHEAGHLFFSIFGQTLYILGGSIFQIVVPAAWIIVALRQESRLTPVALYFTGYSTVDVSIYIKDAATRYLPLIGGKKTHHDWANVLGKYDMLDWGVPLGELFFFTGMIVCFTGLIWGMYLSFRLRRQDASSAQELTE